MTKQPLELTTLAEQSLTVFEVKNALRTHVGRECSITSHYSTRAGKFHVVAGDHGGLWVVLESEGEVLYGGN